jgi:hypothetical protein
MKVFQQLQDNELLIKIHATTVFQFKICGKSSALRVAAKRS